MFRAKQTDNKARLMNIKIEDHQTDKTKIKIVKFKIAVVATSFMQVSFDYSNLKVIYENSLFYSLFVYGIGSCCKLIYRFECKYLVKIIEM